MLPLVLNEQLVHGFKFYLNEQVQQGIRHNSVLYGLVCGFPVTRRLEAYRYSCQLAETGASVVTTVSEEGYKVWVDLTASQYLQWDLYVQHDITPVAA